MRPLLICTLVPAAVLGATLDRWSNQPAMLERYQFHSFKTAAAFLQFVEHEQHQIDCLILPATDSAVFTQLQQRAMLLPAIALRCADHDLSDYHSAILYLDSGSIENLGQAIEQAISKFLSLAVEPPADAAVPPVTAIAVTSSLLLQQRRLAEKLHARLDYQRLYYKRNPQMFLNHLAPSDRQALLHQLKLEYREILLQYFVSRSLNEQIDLFVSQAFFADVSVAVMVEMHMELMDEFSKQLKLEGRSDEVLLDYRLTLIDMLAHLCEMYRRSVPQ